MADLLTTSTITQLVNTYKSSETNKLVAPLTTRKSKYSSISSAYGSVLSYLNALKTEASAFNKTESDSIFKAKTASSSGSSFVTAAAGSATLGGSYELRVGQLAKKDVALSLNMTSSAANAITGTHTFSILTGDGEGGQFTSHISVDFDGTGTNKTVMEKIQNAINSDKASVNGSYVTGADAYSGGASNFIINLNGTETTISLDGSAATYSELLDQVVSQVSSNIEGVEVSKVADPQDPTKFRLSLKATNSSNYISITHKDGNDLVSGLGISATKEKGASGMVSASSFSPVSGSSQLTITAKESGLDYRIMGLSDDGGSTALDTLGLNLGSTRTTFNQNGNVPGFIYSDITYAGNQLNSKFVFNGLDIQRNTNTITDLADGLTLNLKSIMSASDNTVNITVSNDTSGIKSKVENFIKKFNDLYSYLKTNSSYSSGTRGILYGDSSAQTIISSMSGIAGSIVGTDVTTNSLSKIGITFNSSTGLSITDSSALERKLSENSEGVAALFNSGSGITKKLESFIQPYTGSGGYITLQKNSIEKNVKYLSDRITSTEARIDKSTEMLRHRYETLQAQLAAMMTVQSYFTSGLTS